MTSMRRITNVARTLPDPTSAFKQPQTTTQVTNVLEISRGASALGQLATTVTMTTRVTILTCALRKI